MEIGYDGCKTDVVFIRIPRLPLQRSKYKYTEYPVLDKYNESIYIYIYCWINVTDNGLFHIRYTLPLWTSPKRDHTNTGTTSNLSFLY